MKKIITAVIALMAVATMVLGMTACGASPEEKLKTFIESDAFQSQIDSYKSSFGSTLDIDVKAEENKLIYEFTYKTQIEDSVVDSVKDQLDTASTSMASTYEEIANQLKAEIKIDNPVVVLKYLNADGTTIYEHTFEATE
ncbi:MAG: DUF4854 domain-containing protein [Ruminococcus sp.]|nr:DUF4854 domain-containing protein [Ruminococcus sp.]